MYMLKYIKDMYIQIIILIYSLCLCVHVSGS